MAKETKEKKIIAIKLDQAEMAIRIVEGLTGTARPGGKSPREYLEDMKEESQKGLFNASRAIAEYVYEQIIEAGAEDVGFLDEASSAKDERLN